MDRIKGTDEICIVYDSKAYSTNFKTNFGFSCLIRFRERYILFDTGSDSRTLLHNLRELGVEPREIEIVFISHSHWDHAGGLTGFLEENPSAKIYVPEEDFFGLNKEKINAIFLKTFTKIEKGIYSTGALGSFIKEQALILDTDKGLVIITGCSHPGVENFVKVAKENLNKKIYLVLGGFHIDDATKVIKSFKEFGVKKVAPCHCTGEKAIQQFKKEYKENFVETGVGRVIKIK